MKIKLLFIFLIFTLSGLALYANGNQQLIDTTCCTPDSLKVVSIQNPIFCISWHIPTDSGCIAPYGFIIEWAKWPGVGPWKQKTVIYTSGSTINFCDSIDTCGRFQWRVKTICIRNGITTYSDWVYGPRFNVDCSHDRPYSNSIHPLSLNVKPRYPKKAPIRDFRVSPAVSNNFLLYQTILVKDSFRPNIVKGIKT